MSKTAGVDINQLTMKPDIFAKLVELLKVDHRATATGIALQVDSPTVFLIDEHHSSDSLIDDNIAIARTLIRIANVTLVGVEGCAGGRITLQDLKNPFLGRCFGGRHRLTAAILGSSGLEVVGVDSPELCNQISEDCQQGKWIPSTHPSEELRSAHMATRLIQTIRERGNIQAALLNGGARHNDDIEAIIRGVKSHDIGADGVSFVRIRSRLFPT
jgi:hypothetical protein